MKKIITFFKNSKNKLYLKLIEILLESEKPQLSKKIKNDWKENFWFFEELQFSEKILFVFFSIISFLILIFWIYGVCLTLGFYYTIGALLFSTK